MIIFALQIYQIFTTIAQFFDNRA